MCTGCGLRCFKEEFQPSQWVRKDCVHYCKGCCHAKIQAGTPLECITGCGQWKAKAAFTETQQKKTIHRICIDCEDFGVCKECGLTKRPTEFTANELDMSRKAGNRGRCRNCMQRNQETKQCSLCKENVHDKNTPPTKSGATTTASAMGASREGT